MHRVGAALLFLLSSVVIGFAQPVAQNPVPDVNQALRSIRTLSVQVDTWLAKPEMCEGALQSKKEFESWGIALLRQRYADGVLKIDHQPGWFYYQYSLSQPSTGLVLASGNVTAWDGKVACGKIANKIIERMKRARAVKTEAAEKQ